MDEKKYIYRRTKEAKRQSGEVVPPGHRSAHFPRGCFVFDPVFRLFLPLWILVPFVSYLPPGQADRVSYVSVVHSRSKILQLRTKTRLIKEENWRGPSCLDCSLHYPASRGPSIFLDTSSRLIQEDRRASARRVSLHKLSRIYYFCFNSAETYGFEAAAFGLNFRFIKNHIHYFSLCQKKGLFITAVAFFYS